VGSVSRLPTGFAAFFAGVYCWGPLCTVAGTSIVITMLVNIVAPHLNFLIKKLRVFCRRKPAETLVTQAQIDKVLSQCKERIIG
jgi:hypothetical protein